MRIISAFPGGACMLCACGCVSVCACVSGSHTHARARARAHTHTHTHTHTGALTKTASLTTGRWERCGPSLRRLPLRGPSLSLHSPTTTTRRLLQSWGLYLVTERTGVGGALPTFNKRSAPSISKRASIVRMLARLLGIASAKHASVVGGLEAYAWRGILCHACRVDSPASASFGFLRMCTRASR